ncbi:T9SS type A sorting domain-containing protein [Flavivirga eckloniae]|uniref:Secretion system C-terminal sorting domain-containing protein n=1 Tax=Flavivirga eckloniae TaxID=1803846 RepID=A0A2K9PNU7_9FLAO|nr:T9SS type A sorting domain-containing protein [Flavivirga eckloniae]AUP78722.1 hypothetical protein C1H87_08420 [Flavivirga eckloniae]
MKRITILFAILSLVFNMARSQTVFNFDTNATDNGDNITETIDGITMTLSGASDLRLVNGGGAFGTSGDAAMTTIAPTSLTIIFSEAVNVNSILPFSASAQSLTYTLTPDGGGSPEMVVITSGAPPGNNPVDLNWTNVTTITVTSSTGSANFGFDDISVSAISSPPATVFNFDTNATDNGDNITETIDGITMTLSGASDLRLVNGGGAFGTSGDAAMTTIAPTSLTITFSEAVNVNSILPFSASAQSLTYTLTPDGGGSPEMVVITSGAPPGNNSVDLNWTNVTTITVTSSTGSANFGFDDISVSISPPATVFDFDTNATDNGDNITETIDGITMTLSGASDLRLVNGGGAFGTSGDAAMTTIAPTSLTITFSEAVNVNSILPFSASAQSLTYTLTPDGGGSPEMVVITNGAPPGDSPVDLNWTNVTTITVTSSTGSANFGFDDISVTANPQLLRLELIAYLQGASINPNTGEETLMRDDLRVAGNIPTTSPYADALTCDASVFAITGSDAIVDWVFVELRDENDNSVVIESQSALLQRDGDVVGVDGDSAPSFSSSAGNYFVSINHRNHLGVVSSSAIALSSTVATVDFTASSASAEGGANALTDLGNGIFAIYAGDYDANAQVQNTDASGVTLLIGGSGYSDADIDINDQVQNTDLQNLINPNIGKGEQFSKIATKAKSTFINLAAPGITVTFENAQNTNDGANDFYEVDVFIEGTEDFKLGSGQFYINYNTAAFGTNIFANNKIEYTQPGGSILGEVYGFPAYKDFIQNDNTDSRVSFSFQQGVSSGSITANNVTTTKKLLAHLKFEYIDTNEEPMINFEIADIFLDQFYTACGPNTAGFPDCTSNDEAGEQITDDTFDSTLSIDGNNEFMELVMYPNPTNSVFHIEGLREKVNLSIYDIQGKLILKQDNYLNTPVEVTPLKSGLYLVKIENSQGVRVKRLIKR